MTSFSPSHALGSEVRSGGLRVWPGVAIVTVQWLMWLGLPIVAPEYAGAGMMASVAAGPAILVWWLFFSRAPWPERLGAVAVMAAAVLATPLVLHESIAAGAMGMLFYILVVPGLSLAFVIWASVSHRLPGVTRHIALVAAVLVACGGWAAVRTGGFTASFDNDLHWRWAETPEDRLLAEPDPKPLTAASVAPAPTPASPETPALPATSAPSGQSMKAAAPTPPPAVATATSPRPEEWPGFRGRARNGIANGARIATDWTSKPPQQVWRRAIGPGWSSFAVSGDLLFTQEQRGDDEIVAAYRVSTGEPVWRHRDATRFWESNGGAGPRGTPTLSRGRVYAFGATGILNALDANTGSVIWSRNVAGETGVPVPMWGFSSSPLVMDDLVVIAAAGTLAAYEAATGTPRWTGPRHDGEGYSSPQLVTIGGVPQIVLITVDGATAVSPGDGTALWEHPWAGMGGPIVQPALTAEGDLLISTQVNMGGGAIRRLAVAQEQGGWIATERWTTSGLKPYFNDYIVHKGHAYGFDGAILACVDLADGARKWKGGRYGNGQLVLLPDQDLLLVVSEEGELALVGATPDRFQAIARVPGIEGKTWNHPVVVGDLLLVRNGEEMAAFRLARAQ
jgi:outer membrane protein assembly factor BamB